MLLTSLYDAHTYFSVRRNQDEKKTQCYSLILFCEKIQKSTVLKIPFKLSNKKSN